MLHSITTAAFTGLAFGVGLILFVWKAWAHAHRRSIAHLAGPPAHSWLVGNIPEFYHVEVGDAEFEWTKRYGHAFRIKGCFGENILYLCDPKGLQYVLNRRGYHFSKTWEMLAFLRLLTGRGITTVDGSNHARHRRVMMPSFSNLALKEYLPLFLVLSRKTTFVWKELIRKQNAGSYVLDVLSLLRDTAFDAIGKAAFDYGFNSIESTEPKTELHKAYQNLLVDVSYMPSNFAIIFRRLLGYLPIFFLDAIKYLPTNDIQRLKHIMTVSRNVGKDLVDKQSHAEVDSKEGGKDVMSLLVKANNAENPRRRLDEEEILSQITTLLLAGHETISNALGWTLYELVKHPETQQKLRDEVKATRANIASRGGTEITIDDLDSMKYMIAVLKETLRYRTVVEHLRRRAAHDDVIPLDTPVRTVSGEMITSIPIRQGQILHLALGSYNRISSLWGPDADKWKPERFLHEEPLNGQKVNFGVFGNLASFSSGLHRCIGWRFAVVEIQAVLIELLDKFTFSPAPNVEIKSASCMGIIQSMVKGQESKGAQMPLTVTILRGGIDVSS